MNKLWKSFVVIFACVAMVLSSSSPVLAQDFSTTYTYDGKVYTITSSTDNNNVTTVNVTSVDGTSTVVLDKNANTAMIIDIDASGTKIIDETVTGVDPTVVDPMIAEPVVDPMGISPMAVGLTAVGTDAIARPSTLIASRSEPMFKHYYSVSRMASPVYYVWVVCKSTAKGICKTRRETSSNAGELAGFKDDINSAAKNEAIAKTMIGAGILSAIAAAISGVPTVGVGVIIGLLVAFGATIGAAAYIYSAWVDIKDADYHYARV